MSQSTCTLVLVVDIDDDLGYAGIATPVIGEGEVEKVAISYARENPEDSDVNALFAGLKLLSEMRGQGRDAEIAVVAGDPVNTVEAHRKVLEQVGEVVGYLRGRGCGEVEIVLVSDGAEDETVIPIIQGRYRIVAVKRVVVTQHVGVETTYIVLGRMIKKAMFEPRFSKYFLGVPGLMILILGMLAVANLLSYAVEVGAILLGGAMIVRGFGLEPFFENLGRKIKLALIPKPEEMHLSIISASILLVTTLVSLWLASLFWGSSGNTIYDVASILEYPLIIEGIGVIGFLTGRFLIYTGEDDRKAFEEVIRMIVAASMVIAGFILGRGLARLPPDADADMVSAAVIDSGFLHVLLGGMGIAALLYIYWRIKYTRSAPE